MSKPSAVEASIAVNLEKSGGDVFDAIDAVDTEDLQQHFGIGKYKVEADLTQQANNYFSSSDDEEEEGNDGENESNNNNNNATSPLADDTNRNNENYSLSTNDFWVANGIRDRMGACCTFDDNEGNDTGVPIARFGVGLPDNKLDKSPTSGYTELEKQDALNMLKLPEEQRKGLANPTEAIKSLCYVSESNLVKWGFSINDIISNIDKKNIDRCIITKRDKPAIKENNERYFLIAACPKINYKPKKGMKYIMRIQRIKNKLDKSLRTTIGSINSRHITGADITEDGAYFRYDLVFIFRHNILSEGVESFKCYKPIKESSAVLEKMREEASMLGRQARLETTTGKLYMTFYFVAYEVDGDNESGYRKKGKPLKKWIKPKAVTATVAKGGIGGAKGGVGGA